MNIKLNAKLSAYSKIESVADCDHSIDFVSTSEIDKLFKSSVDEEDVSQLQENENFVSFSDIDSLFGWLYV